MDETEQDDYDFEDDELDGPLIECIHCGAPVYDAPPGAEGALCSACD